MTNKVRSISPQQLHVIWQEGEKINLIDVRTSAATVNLSRLIVILIKNKPVTYLFLVWMSQNFQENRCNLS